MPDQFFIDSVGYKARLLSINAGVLRSTLVFSSCPTREKKGSKWLHDDSTVRQGYVWTSISCTKYSVQSIYSLRIYAEMSYKLTDINHCIIHIHTGLGSTSWLVACWCFRRVHHIIAPFLGWWGRWIAGGKGYTRISVVWHDYGQTSVIQSRLVSS